MPLRAIFKASESCLNIQTSTAAAGGSKADLHTARLGSLRLKAAGSTTPSNRSMRHAT